MKKIILLIVCCVCATAWANVKLDFMISVRKQGCDIVKWIENDYEGGILWKQYAKVSCKEKIALPPRIVGLKFFDVTDNLKGEFIYTYGLEK